MVAAALESPMMSVTEEVLTREHIASKNWTSCIEVCAAISFPCLACKRCADAVSDLRGGSSRGEMRAVSTTDHD